MIPGIGLQKGRGEGRESVIDRLSLKDTLAYSLKHLNEEKGTLCPPRACGELKKMLHSKHR